MKFITLNYMAYIKKGYSFGWSQGDKVRPAFFAYDSHNKSGMLVISIKFKAQFLLPTFIGSGLDKSRRQVFGGPFSFHLSIILIFNFPRPAPPRIDKLKRVTTPMQHTHLSQCPPQLNHAPWDLQKQQRGYHHHQLRPRQQTSINQWLQVTFTDLKRGHHVTAKERK